MNSGIYEIRNTYNNMRYIGRSADIQRRKKDHISKLARGVHENIKLQRAWRKYGSKRFKFSVIWEEPPENLIELEGMILEELFDTGTLYNCHKNSNGGGLGFKFSEEQKNRLRTSLMNSEAAKKHREWMQTPEAIKLRTEAAARPDVRARALAKRGKESLLALLDKSREKKKADAKARLFAALDWAVENKMSRDEALTKFGCSWGSLKLHQAEWESINGKLDLPLRASGAKSGMFKHGLSKEMRRRRTPEELAARFAKQSEIMSGAGNPMFGRRHTDDARRIQSEAAKRQAEQRRLDGYVVSEETRKKQRDALRGKPKSEQHIANSAFARLGGRIHTPGGIFSTSVEAEAATGVKSASVLWRCHNESPKWADWYIA